MMDGSEEPEIEIVEDTTEAVEQESSLEDDSMAVMESDCLPVTETDVVIIDAVTKVPERNDIEDHTETNSLNIAVDGDDTVCLEAHQSDQDAVKEDSSTNEDVTEQNNEKFIYEIAETNTEKILNGESEVTINDTDIEQELIDEETESAALKTGTGVRETVSETVAVEIVGPSCDGTEGLTKDSETSNQKEVLTEPAKDIETLESINKSAEACEPTVTANSVKTVHNNLKKKNVVKQNSSTVDSTPSEPITEGLFNKLVNHLHEKDEKLIKDAKEKIAKILETQTTRATELLVDIRKKRARMPRRSVKILLNLIKQKCIKRTDIDTETIQKLVTFALKELTNSSQYDPLVQNAALEVLVAIGSDKHTKMVVEALTEHKEKDSVTHFMILHSLGKLATANEKAMIPFMKPLLSTLLLPNLVDPKSVHLKQAQTYAIRCFSEALLNQSKTAPGEEAITSLETPSDDKGNSSDDKGNSSDDKGNSSDDKGNSNEAQESDPIDASFATQISETYNLLYNQWLHTHEPKVSVDILETLSSLGFLLTKIEKRPKLGGSGRKRMAILLRQGFGIDEARFLAQRPMAELEHLYTPNRRRMCPQPLDNSNNISSEQKRKIHSPPADTKIPDVKKPALKSTIDLQRFSWRRKPDEEPTSNKCNSEVNCESKEDAEENNKKIEPPSKFPKRLSGAGKKRLNILLNRGMDIEQARIKALIPLAHWKHTGVIASKTISKKYSKNVISKFKNTLNKALIIKGVDADHARIKAVKPLGHWRTMTSGNKGLQGTLTNRVKTKIDASHSQETISTPKETITTPKETV